MKNDPESFSTSTTQESFDKAFNGPGNKSCKFQSSSSEFFVNLLFKGRQSQIFVTGFVIRMGTELIQNKDSPRHAVWQ